MYIQGAVEMVTSGVYDVAYSLTLTDHATSAMHEHAGDMFGLHWLGRRARLRALRLCHSAAGAPWHSRSTPSRSRFQTPCSYWKLTARPRPAAPATRAGRCSCSWSCTRWSAALSCGAHLGIVGRTKRAARSSRQLDGYTRTGHQRVPGTELASAGDVEGPSQRPEPWVDFRPLPVCGT